MKPNLNKNKGIAILLALALLISLLYLYKEASSTGPQYSEIIQLFRDQKITEFTLNLGSGQLTYKEKGDTAFKTYKVPSVDLFIYNTEDYIKEYDETHSVPLKYDYVQSTSWLNIIVNWMPMLLSVVMLVLFYVSMSQQGGGRINNISKARVQQENEGRKVTFAEVAGADEEKEELQEIIDFLKNPAKYNKLGAKIPSGVLLIGPPGTGKTLLARAVAGEAGCPFFSISGSDFVELYVGVGAARVRDLFDRAKRNRPSIVFIDEIDAVGRQRGTGLGGGHDEREQTLNQLLVEMDGFGINEGVIVMAATNRSDILDPALLRPGRFDRQIYVGYPDVKGREEILKVHARGKPLGPDIDLGVIAKSTVGFTGADLENLLNEAALLAARKNKKAITQEEIEEASIKVIVGPEKRSRVVHEKERKLTAYHEAGHAIATFYATPESPVHQISIIPRGTAGGFTMSLPKDDINYQTRNEMLGNIVTLLGGRVAEQKVLDDISTGASNDLERATAIARSMVTKYGFSDKLGPVVYGSQSEVFLGRDFTQSRNYSEQIATDIDVEIRNIVEECYDKCSVILDEHMDKLHLVAQRLMEKEKIEEEEFTRMMNGEPEETESAVTETEPSETSPADPETAPEATSED
ncbi:MAG: ATP-dependent zinc metalloprotease FtsH [Oscillospiraceae bacterium]|nr:ATP-dependent zinc metalloprotease FtsH [Oscillospiraceae bacterium]